jgi:hypothetical protein
VVRIRAHIIALSFSTMVTLCSCSMLVPMLIPMSDGPTAGPAWEYPTQTTPVNGLQQMGNADLSMIAENRRQQVLGKVTLWAQEQPAKSLRKPFVIDIQMHGLTHDYLMIRMLQSFALRQQPSELILFTALDTVAPKIRAAQRVQFKYEVDAPAQFCGDGFACVMLSDAEAQIVSQYWLGPAPVSAALTARLLAKFTSKKT